jgi:hypothetical protein
MVKRNTRSVMVDSVDFADFPGLANQVAHIVPLVEV